MQSPRPAMSCRVRPETQPLRFDHPELRVLTPEYVISIRPDDREKSSRDTAAQVDRVHLFDPRLLQVASSATSILFHHTLEDSILYWDIRNESTQDEVLNGVRVKHIAFDRVIGDRLERWIAPEQGFAVLRCQITSNLFAGEGPFQGRSTVRIVERTMEEFHPGVWIPHRIHRRLEFEGRVVGEEVVEIESVDFLNTPRKICSRSPVWVLNRATRCLGMEGRSFGMVLRCLIPLHFVRQRVVESRPLRRRPPICDGRDSGAGGQYSRALCGLMVLYSTRHRSISTFASNSVSKISPFSNSSLSFPLNDSK